MRSDAIRRTIRKVMDWVKLLLVLATCVYLAHCLKQCGQSSPEQPTERTVTVYDTIPYYYPVARDSVVVRYERRRLPVDTTVNVDRETGFTDKTDSADVVIPITQKEYRDSTYHVWISGYAANLDSIYTYGRHDYTTVMPAAAKPKRWHLGVCAGYGYTSKGFQPYVGIGISYSLLSWK